MHPRLGHRPAPKLLLAAAVLAALAAACIPLPPDIPEPPNSPGLSRAVLVDNLDHPWDIAFLAGSTTFLYTEGDRATVSAYIPGVDSRRVLGTIFDSNPAGEGGVMGIAVDPGYPSRPFVYVCYSTASDNRVVKFTLDTSLPAGTALSSPVPLVTGIAHAQAHNGCRVRFQPGSNPPALFVTTGDGAVGTNPQNPDSDAGKVLRLTADGAPYPGNPWGATIQQAFVYAYGFRNPQGIAFRPGTNQPYISEHGPDYNDEVTALVVGGNGGWNPVPGYNQHVVMTDLGLPNVMIPKWRSGDGGTIAPSGATFLTGAQWKAWDGALAVAVLKGSHLRVMFLDDQGGISATSTVLSLGVRLRSAVEGPDGKLYISTDIGGGNDQIWQVTPT